MIILLLVLCTTSVQADRYSQLTQSIRCMVCDNQSIAESRVPLAIAMKRVVAEKIKQGETDAAIYQFMRQRYGDDVLYEPPFVERTWFLWLLPYLVFVCLIAFVWRSARLSIDKTSKRQ